MLNFQRNLMLQPVDYPNNEKLHYCKLAIMWLLDFNFSKKHLKCKWSEITYRFEKFQKDLHSLQTINVTYYPNSVDYPIGVKRCSNNVSLIEDVAT